MNHVFSTRFIISLIQIVCASTMLAQSSADLEFEAVQKLTGPSAEAEQSTAAPQKNAPDAAALLSIAAGKANEFRVKYPLHSKAGEAKALEAMSLLKAALAGDQSQGTRASVLVAEVLDDETIDSNSKVRLAIMRETVGLQPFMNNLEQLGAAREASARRLVEAFPEETGSYEMFLRAAETNADSAAGVRLAQELMRMPVPSSVKAHAQLFIDRQGLIGQQLFEIAKTALGPDSPIGHLRGKVIVLYTWASWSPGSMANAKEISDAAPNAALVGLNYDTEVDVARTIARQQAMPGVQIYDANGPRGALALTLKVGFAMPVFIINSGGEIRQIIEETSDLVSKVESAF